MKSLALFFAVLVLAMSWTAQPSESKPRGDRGGQELLAIDQRFRALYAKGDYQAALAEARKLVALTAKSGKHHANYANALGREGKVNFAMGRYEAAEQLYRQAISILQAEGVSNDVAITEADLGQALHYQGRYAEAEEVFKRSMAALEKAKGVDPTLVAEPFENLGVLYWTLGRYADAEPLYQRALAIREHAAKPDFPAIAVTLNNLGALYWSLGRYAEAEPLYKRAEAVEEKSLGPNHPGLARILNNLGTNYLRAGRYADAEPLFERAIEIREQALARDHPDVAEALNNLAVDYRHLGRAADGVPLLRRALSIWEKTVGPEHISNRYSLVALANAYLAMGRAPDAEPYAARALDIAEKAVGPQHPESASIYKTLAEIDLATGRTLPAVEASRKAVHIVVDRLENHAAASVSPDPAALREYFDVVLASLYRAVSERVLGDDAIGESFRVAQWANQSAASTALNQLAGRIGAGSTALAALVREQQDDAGELRALEKVLLAELGKPIERRNLKREDATRKRMQELESRLDGLHRRISVDHPDYADLANPKPLSPADAAKLIAADEALVLYHVGSRGSFVWAITKDRIEWREIKFSAPELEQRVEKLRASLDPDRVKQESDLFDLDAAYELYAAVLGPVEEVISGKPNLLVVASGALTSLPFHILVTAKPASRFDYREAAWLARRHAVTVLPSVASLKSLQRAVSAAPEPYLGFGDPDYSSARRLRGHKPAVEQPSRGIDAGLPYRAFFRGGRADVRSLSNALAPLPDSADEVRSIARILGASDRDIRLGRNASEAEVKSTRLDRYRIVHFATHALVAGETARFNEQAEPAIVLTLPEEPTDLDDGLLTASEVALLKLDADWVLLSACNTAAGERPGAEALSGLARAFFYAGARTLLVSHWHVQTTAASRLLVGTIQAIESSPGLSPAQALRRAMLTFIEDPEAASAYPGVWGPFAIVGYRPRSGE